MLKSLVSYVVLLLRRLCLFSILCIFSPLTRLLFLTELLHGDGDAELEKLKFTQSTEQPSETHLMRLHRVIQLHSQSFELSAFPVYIICSHFLCVCRKTFSSFNFIYLHWSCKINTFSLSESSPSKSRAKEA